MTTTCSNGLITSLLTPKESHARPVICSRIHQPKASHVTMVVALEPLGQTLLGFPMRGAEIVQERMAGCPATFRCAQHDDRATAVKSGDQARPITFHPGGGNQIHRLVAWYA